ncbi:unnamed protein product [Clonostachys rosea f. rosea IK726]|uniref:Uncharacterized protein n=1 Tax=Clonostachys rosea f. rosea IK726 TaxID=1349383 RepID=A0ACA9TQV2_BIOOC|nr:unnamed protein product [Clonostachys rosea f. rosea IK726]
MPLRQLYPEAGDTSVEEKVDIIAVHGLNPRNKKDEAHAWDTWRSAGGRLWLRDDLPKMLSDARIFLYRYKATAVYGSDQGTFLDKADELLEAIRAERDDIQTRPIIFLGHSMGGLLIKQALINAHNNPKYRKIKDATSGIGFFATPHRGVDSSLMSLGEVVAKIADRAGFRQGDNILEVLKQGSMFADVLRENWRHQILQYDIISFWGGSDKIVLKENARLGMPGDRENVVRLDAGHGGVCRFGSEITDEDNLKLVLRNVKDLYVNAIQIGPKTGLKSPVSKQPLHLLPFLENRKFTGRESALEDIRQLFFVEGRTRIALDGLGGIGKTQVALQFAYWVKKNKPEYSIFWVPALSRASFDQVYAEIFNKLQVRETESDHDVGDSVRIRLTSNKSGK